MKKLLVLCLLAGFMLVMSACGDSTPEATPAPTPTPTPEAVEATEPPEVEEVVNALSWNGWAPFAEDWEPFDEDYFRWMEAFNPADLGGITVRINAGNPDDIEDEFVREHRQERRDWLEQAFNITLEFDAIVGIDWADVPAQVIASSIAGDPLVNVFNGANANSWLTPMARAGVLLPDQNNFIRNSIPADMWQFAGEVGGTIYGHESMFPYAANNALVYNRDLITSIGMTMTPSEMFLAGRWSQDDFYEYLGELTALLPEGHHAIGFSHEVMVRGFAFANNHYVINPATGVPGYLDEPFLEGVRTLQRIAQSGFMQPLGWIPAEEGTGGTWSLAAAHFPPITAEFNEGRLAMTHIQRWQFAGAASNFEFATVPFPWGSQITWPGEGNWQALKDQGYSNYTLDANLLVIVQGSPGVAEGLLNHDTGGRIWFSYDFREPAYSAITAFRAGEPDPTPVPNLADLFTEIDREIWQWNASTPALCVMNRMGGAPTIFAPILQAIGNNTDIRPTLEAVQGQHVWTMFQAGNIRLEDMPEAVRIQAETFGLSLEQEEDEE